MRTGVLHRRNGQSLSVEVQKARTLFETSEHTSGLTPREARFNPCELPGEIFINGLTIVADHQVQIGHIRVTTEEEPNANETL